MYPQLPFGFVITSDEEADWSEFEAALQTRYNIPFPGKMFDLFAPGYIEKALEELSEQFTQGHALAAWRALRLAGFHRTAVPSWVTDHFSHALSEFLTSRSFQPLMGTNSADGRSQVQLLQDDYVRARRYAALIAADYAGKTGDSRTAEAQEILKRQGIRRGSSTESLKQSWTELNKTVELGLISSVEFIEMLYFARNHQRQHLP